MTPRVDPKQLRPPTGRTAVRTRASAQAPSPRAPAQARRDFGPGDHLICGRKRSPRSRQPRLTPARLPRRATGPLFGEVQTLGCPPGVTVAASATTPAPAPADARIPLRRNARSGQTASFWFSSRRPPEIGLSGTGLRPRATGYARRTSGPRLHPDCRCATVESFDLRIDRCTNRTLRGIVFQEQLSHFRR